MSWELGVVDEADSDLQRVRGLRPLGQILSTVKMTACCSETSTAVNATEPLQMIVDGIADGRFQSNIDRVFQFNEIVEAYKYMDSNQAKGKVVGT